MQAWHCESDTVAGSEGQDQDHVGAATLQRSSTVKNTDSSITFCATPGGEGTGVGARQGRKSASTFRSPASVALAKEILCGITD